MFVVVNKANTKRGRREEGQRERGAKRGRQSLAKLYLV